MNKIKEMFNAWRSIPTGPRVIAVGFLALLSIWCMAGFATATNIIISWALFPFVLTCLFVLALFVYWSLSEAEH